MSIATDQKIVELEQRVKKLESDVELLKVLAESARTATLRLPEKSIANGKRQ